MAEHLRVFRPWGSYQSIDLGDRFQVKRIVVKPGGRLSLQKHFHRAEHWVVVRGTALVTIGDRQKILRENESTYIPLGEVHRLENPGKIPLEIIEVQSGSYLGEDDIVRLEDIYNRDVIERALHARPTTASRRTRFIRPCRRSERQQQLDVDPQQVVLGDTEADDWRTAF